MIVGICVAAYVIYKLFTKCIQWNGNGADTAAPEYTSYTHTKDNAAENKYEGYREDGQ